MFCFCGQKSNFVIKSSNKNAFEILHVINTSHDLEGASRIQLVIS